MPTDITSESPKSSITFLHTSNIPEYLPDNETFSTWKESWIFTFVKLIALKRIKKFDLLKSIGAALYIVLHSLLSSYSPI